MAAFLVTRELHQERLAIFCPFEESKVFNDRAAPGNQLEDLNPVPAVYCFIVPAVKGKNSQVAFHVTVVKFVSLSIKICIFFV